MEAVVSWATFLVSPVGLISAVAVVALALYAYIFVMAKSMYATPDHTFEATFVTGSSGARQAFPSVNQDPEVLVSVVVPAYNEEARMPTMLDDMMAYIEQKRNSDRDFTAEVIIVNDGSKDGTARVAMEYVERYGSDTVRFCDLHRNHGKGGAVRKGVMRARGKYILMADADGATRASDLGSLLSQLQKAESKGQGIAVGSRAHLQAEDEAKASRSAFRKFLMWGFHVLMSLVLGGSAVKDTQCGFKLFTRATAARIFPAQHIERWAFDVELLYLASTWGDVPVVEVAVNWEEIDGSKVDVVWDTLQMARDLVLIRASYALGLWSARPDGSLTPKDKDA